MIDIDEFKEIILAMKTEAEIYDFIEKRYFDLRKLLIEKYHASFCDGINEDQWDKPPQNAEESILNEYYIFSDLWRKFIQIKTLGLEDRYEVMLKPFRGIIENRKNELKN
jgi:hypothetical protein